jgi:hypothetical protein
MPLPGSSTKKKQTDRSIFVGSRVSRCGDMTETDIHQKFGQFEDGDGGVGLG